MPNNLYQLRTYLEELMRRILVAFVLGLVFISTSAWAQSVNGVFRVVKGDVSVKAAKGGAVTKARVGAKVFPQDTIITGKDARAKIVMTDNNEINVSPDSQIALEKYEYKPEEGKKDVLINVLYGKVRSKVEQKYEGENKFQVKTPSAVAGVRGTDFLAGYNQQTKESSVVTFRGVVEVGQAGPNGAIGQSVRVAAGNFTVKAPGQAPATPSAMPKAELASLDKQSDAEKAPAPGADSNERQPAGDKKEDKKDEKKDDGAKADEPKKEEGKKEEAKSEEPKKEEGKKSDTAKTEEPKKDSAKGDSGAKSDTAKSDSGAKGNAPAAGGSSGGSGSGDSGSRAPASLAPATGPAPTASGSMLQSGDLKAPTGGFTGTTTTVILPPLVQSPGANFNIIPKNDFIDSATQNTNANLTITIKQGAAPVNPQ
jgi:hypothetical protein